MQMTQHSCASLTHIPKSYLVPGTVLGTMGTETHKDIAPAIKQFNAIVTVGRISNSVSFGLNLRSSSPLPPPHHEKERKMSPLGLISPH